MDYNKAITELAICVSAHLAAVMDDKVDGLCIAEFVDVVAEDIRAAVRVELNEKFIGE